MALYRRIGPPPYVCDDCFGESTLFPCLDSDKTSPSDHPSTATMLVFSVYIGSKFEGVSFADVPINPKVDFRFLLSSAADYSTGAHCHYTNGLFKTFWDSKTLSSSAVEEIKKNHSNVKVVLSLGGDVVAGTQRVIFKPLSIKSWVERALKSLTKLIDEFHIDGIDIKYEHFQCDNDTFAECIGQLITKLKLAKKISFASIAPYDDESGQVKAKYEALWTKYSSHIDYVNFQFYKQDIKEVTQFLDHYTAQQSIYGDHKVLAGFISDGSEGLTVGKGFFDACQELLEDENLQGIFVWAADLSKANSWSFERNAQHILARNNY